MVLGGGGLFPLSEVTLYQSCSRARQSRPSPGRGCQRSISHQGKRSAPKLVPASERAAHKVPTGTSSRLSQNGTRGGTSAPIFECQLFWSVNFAVLFSQLCQSVNFAVLDCQLCRIAGGHPGGVVQKRHHDWARGPPMGEDGNPRILSLLGDI